MREKRKVVKIMKNITKVIALVLVLCMVFVGCGKKTDNNANTKKP